ncbi:MAG: rRNA adenine N-6-methyltransferase family protein [Microlunatus sp.]
MHFEKMAAEYAAARPPYPEVIYETLESQGVIGPGIRVLEIGAGAGLATRELLNRGSDVVALEPGRQLASPLDSAPFRRRVYEIVARRDDPEVGRSRDQRPTMEELASGGSFEPVRTEHWRWSIDLSAQQIGRLFKTFSNWTTEEAAAAQAAAEQLGGHVTEHYQSTLHLLRAQPTLSS